MSTLLTPEEMKKTRHYNPSFSGVYRVDEVAVAKAQLRKVNGEIESICNDFHENYFDEPNNPFMENVLSWLGASKKEAK